MVNKEAIIINIKNDLANSLWLISKCFVAVDRSAHPVMASCLRARVTHVPADNARRLGMPCNQYLINIRADNERPRIYYQDKTVYFSHVENGQQMYAQSLKPHKVAYYTFLNYPNPSTL